MRFISRVTAILGAAVVSLSLLPAAAASADDAPASSDHIVEQTTVGESETLRYEDGSSFTSTELRSGEFEWTAEFDRGIFSRTYSTPNTGTHAVTVDNITNCATNDYPRIRLERQNSLGVWTAVDTKNIECSGGVAVFTVFDSGTFRWHMELNFSTGDLYGRYATGTTTYP